MSISKASQGSNNSGLKFETKRSIIEELYSLYYLHYSDSPGLVLVSHLLTSENYTSWSTTMLIALSVKNKVCFVEGSLPQPEDVNQEQNSSWIRNM